MNIEINYVAIFLAAVSAMGLGFLWYGPMLFGPKWMKLKGYTIEDLKKEQQDMGKYYGMSFVLSLATAYVLSHVISLSMNFFNAAPLQTGLISSLWMWLGFVLPVQTSNTIFGEKKWNLLAIDTGYQLATLLVMGAVLGILE